MADRSMLTRLSAQPVLGVSLHNVAILRLDRLDALAPGNKRFKLEGNLAAAQAGGVRRLVSFGGAWSNHLHALAAVGRERGIETVGIVRGEAGAGDTATLADAARWGMRLVNVSRGEYRRRNETDYLAALRQRFAPCLVIPEGGANAAGVRGCLAIADLLRESMPDAGRAVLAVGTGTTLAGVAAGLGPGWEVVGVPALKGAPDLDLRVQQALRASGVPRPAAWHLLHHAHCGGFARVPRDLREFILAFEHVHRVPLDPVYTAKALYAIFRLLRSGEWDPDEPVVMIHTGGLQGRRGFPFLGSSLEPAP